MKKNLIYAIFFIAFFFLGFVIYNFTFNEGKEVVDAKATQMSDNNPWNSVEYYQGYIETCNLVTGMIVVNFTTMLGLALAQEILEKKSPSS